MKKNIMKMAVMFTAIFLVVLSGCKTEPEPELHEHTFSEEWTSDATYHWHAATCDDTDEVSGKAEHTFDEGKITTEATEDAEGVKTFTCTVCGYAKTETVEKLAHTHKFSEEWTSDETDHWHTCSGCSEVSGKAAHTWNDGEVTTAPTCTAVGEKTYTCKVCGKTKKEPVAALGHSWNDGEVTTEAKCTSTGVKTYACTVCGKTKTEVVPAKGHDYGEEVITPSTIFEKGQKKVWCNRYGCSLATSARYEDIPALYSTPVVDSNQTPATEDSEYVYFGIFPKIIKAESVTIDETESNSKTMGANKYYKGSDGEWYVKCLEDACWTGNQYKYSNGVEVKQKSAGSYAYFKVEPIKWRVLTTDYNGTGKALLLAEDILTANVPYFPQKPGTGSCDDRTINSNTVYPNNYEYSTIRAYLNGLDYKDNTNATVNDYNSKGFLQTAFTTDAQNLISVTTVDNSGDSTTDATGTKEKADGTVIESGSVENGDAVYYTDYTCPDTSDKIFLLSAKEVTTTTYGFGDYESRVRFGTDYAKANHLQVREVSTWGGNWWLRSPYYNSRQYAQYISLPGTLSSGYLVQTGWGVVPALSISLK